PFRGNGYRAMLELISAAKPTPIGSLVPGLPIDVAAIVDKCLQADRSKRFQSANELAEACIASLGRSSLPRMDLSGEIAAPEELAAEDLHTVASVRLLTPRPALGGPTDPQETSPTRSIADLATGATMTGDSPLDPPTADATTTTGAAAASARLLASRTLTRSSDADSTTRSKSVRPPPPRRWGLAVGALAIAAGLIAFGFSRRASVEPSVGRQETGIASEATDARRASRRSAKEAASVAREPAEPPVARPIANASATSSATSPSATVSARTSPPRVTSSTSAHASTTSSITSGGKPRPASSAAAHEGVINAGF
ncbi:MAG: hypothetical protein ACHREM_33175, partial [Polyangiales bacterium]